MKHSKHIARPCLANFLDGTAQRVHLMVTTTPICSCQHSHSLVMEGEGHRVIEEEEVDWQLMTGGTRVSKILGKGWSTPAWPRYCTTSIPCCIVVALILFPSPATTLCSGAILSKFSWTSIPASKATCTSLFLAKTVRCRLVLQSIKYANEKEHVF